MVLGLNAEIRERLGGRNPRRDRREGRVPAIVYGRGEDPLAIKISTKDMEKIVSENARMVILNGIPGNPQVAIRDIQWGNIGEEIVHVDFLRIALDELMETSTPIELVGTPKGVSGEGILDQVLSEIELSCLPGNLPDAITINIRDLGEGDEIRVKDITPPQGVTFIAEPEAVVCRIIIPKEEEEEAALEAFDMPERIGEPKEEDTETETEPEKK
ncbi:MAG: 50S ribosomal protein L25 [Planctomycetota bacterium]|jgi:large subunit ribosomal protein L25